MILEAQHKASIVSTFVVKSPKDPLPQVSSSLQISNLDLFSMTGKLSCEPLLEPQQYNNNNLIPLGGADYMDHMIYFARPKTKSLDKLLKGPTQ